MLNKKHIIVLFFFILSNIAYADFSSGIDAYKQKDYESAFDLWLPLAKKKDGVAQYNIAKLYQSGQGTEKNQEEALNWFEKALKNGVNIAKKEIKLLQATFFTDLEKSIVLEKERLANLEKERLIKLEKITIDKEDPYFEIHKNANLINDLALSYMKEEGLTNRFNLPQSCSLSHQVKKDCQKVFDWYWQSANKGYTYAQYILGLIYAQGMSHSENIDSAKYWLKQSKTSTSKKIQEKSTQILKLLQD